MTWEPPDIRMFPLFTDAENRRDNVRPPLSRIHDTDKGQQSGVGVLESSLLAEASVPIASCPRPRQTLSCFSVADDLVLLPPDRSFVVSLNSSAKVIWELCDGHCTVSDVSRELAQRYASSSGTVQEDVTQALRIYQQLNLLKFNSPTVMKHKPVKFVVGIEDTVYFHWQLPILLESLNDKLPVGWEVVVVICNNHGPLSEPLSQILLTYGPKYFTATNHPMNENMDFSSGDDFYVPLNRIQALATVADYIQSDDLICLMETDIFLYEDLNLDIFPNTNTLAKDKLIGRDLFFADARNDRGIKIHKLLESFDCPDTFKPGGVLVFLTGETVKNTKFIQDCFRFTQILYLMGKIHGVPKVWTAEMPCFALALTINGIPYDLITTPEFQTQHTSDSIVPSGTFYHYYRDLNDGLGGAFYQSQWYKHQFVETNMLQEDLSPFVSQAHSQHERYFFNLVNKARRRLHASNS